MANVTQFDTSQIIFLLYRGSFLILRAGRDRNGWPWPGLDGSDKGSLLDLAGSCLVWSMKVIVSWVLGLIAALGL